MRKLYEKSQWVVIGKVVPPAASPGFTAPTNVNVSLEVLSIVKGTLRAKSLPICSPSDHECHAPVKYQVGKTVLIFLNEAPDKTGFYPEAESYGVKVLAEKDQALYVRRLQELSAIQNDSNPKQEQARQTVEWLVECVENPVTTWEGVSELAHPQDFIASFGKPPLELLRSAQKDRLAKILYDSRSVSSLDLDLLKVVQKLDDPRVNGFLRHLLEQSDSATLQGITISYRLARRVQSNEARQLIINFWKTPIEDQRKRENVRKLIEQVLLATKAK